MLGFIIVTAMMSCDLSPLAAQKTSWKKHKTPLFTQEPAQSSSTPTHPRVLWGRNRKRAKPSPRVAGTQAARTYPQHPQKGLIQRVLDIGRSPFEKGLGNDDK